MKVTNEKHHLSWPTNLTVVFSNFITFTQFKSQITNLISTFQKIKTIIDGGKQRNLHHQLSSIPNFSFL